MSKSKNKGCWGGLWRRQYREEKFWKLSPHLRPAPRRPFVPLQCCPPAGRQQAATTDHNTGFPACRKQVCFLLSVWLSSHLNSNQDFFKTWSEARPLAFPPGKSSGLMGCTWRVPLQPAAGTAAACGGFTLWLPVRATPRPGGAELQPGGLEASAHWPHLPLFFP